MLLGVSFLFFYLFKDLPSPRKLASDQFPVSTLIYDRNDKLLYEIYGEQNRTPIKLDQLPDYVKQATIAIEDKDFYQHGAFDFRGILRALINIIFKQKLQGGSTITQQLVKTTLLSPERTVRRKVREATLAAITEFIYNKNQILEMYLNHVPYGGTAYGIEQASQKYFNKPAKDLTLAEAALLAGLPAAPTYYSPFGANPQLAKNRQKLVLQRMVEEGYISQKQADQAYSEKLNFIIEENIKAPHFVMYIKQLLVDKFNQQVVEQGGLRVKTTLDLDLQEFAQDKLATEVAKLKNYNVSNASALVTKPATGEILAMVGSRGYFDKEIDGNVNLTTAFRQPGSSIKPVNYALGLLNGYTPADIFLDVPTCFSVEGQPLYCPKNYDGKFHGPVQMRFALGNSYNIPAVKMMALNGVEAMIATASAMGITGWKDPSNYGLALTLGGGEVQMTQMATAFGVFSNNGKRVDLNPFLEIKDYKGNVYESYDPQKNPPAGQRILPESVAFLISHMLLDNNARTAAFGANSELVIPNHAVSVKTGTTDDLKDNWTIGYTPSFLTAVWVGNNDSSPMNPYLVSGVTGAAPIWHDIMAYVLKDQPDEWPKQPKDIEGRQICTFITSANPEEQKEECQGRFEYFIKGTQPRSKIEKKKIMINKDTGWPPEKDNPTDGENLEEQEHLVASDDFVKDYCLDCPEDKRKPLLINMTEFKQKLSSF
jgi:penicillin-binding protein 1C